MEPKRKVFMPNKSLNDLIRYVLFLNSMVCFIGAFINNIKSNFDKGFLIFISAIISLGLFGIMNSLKSKNY